MREHALFISIFTLAFAIATIRSASGDAAFVRPKPVVDPRAIEVPVGPSGTPRPQEPQKPRERQARRTRAPQKWPAACLEKVEEKRPNGSWELTSKVVRTFDEFGNPVRSVRGLEGKESVTVAEYDAFGNAVSTSTTRPGAEPRTSRATYDRFGNALTHTTAWGVTEHAFDERGNMFRSKSTTPVGEVTHEAWFEYDSAGNMIESRSVGAGRETVETHQLHYDSAGRLVFEGVRREGSMGWSRTFAYEYSDEGRLVEKLIGSGPDRARETQRYDADGRPIFFARDRGRDGRWDLEIERTFDRHGNVLVEQRFNRETGLRVFERITYDYSCHRPAE